MTSAYPIAIRPAAATDAPLRTNTAAARLPWPVLLLLAYLAGITIIGKGPTYLGVPPFYWGEAVMVVALVAIAPMQARAGLAPKHGAISIFVTSFMLLGAVITAFSIPRWGVLEVARDAAVWYYGAFFFVGLSLAQSEAISDRVWRVLQVFWVLGMLWGTADYLSGERLRLYGPMIPGRGVPLLFNSTHEVGQNIALGAVIVLCLKSSCISRRIRTPLRLLASVGVVTFLASMGRGMRLGALAAALIAALLSLGYRPAIQLSVRIRSGLLLAVLALPLLLAIPAAVEKTHLDRFTTAPSAADGTSAWRMIWWQRLYGEVMRQNPLFGIGFGESLNVYHPLLEHDQDPWATRSPHNFNVTVFTRMGIAGLALWAAVLAMGIGGLGARVWRGRIAGRRYAPERREELAFWVMMLVCTVVNSSFGVLMEGPVLGVWFWFALGFATGRSQRTGWRVAAEAPGP